MKNSVLLAVFASAILSCNSRNTPARVPKDIAEKPSYESREDADLQLLKDLRQKIDQVANSEKCSDASAWRVSPIGSKPCGGPAAYFAYPIRHENEILALVKEYTQKQSEYNRKKGLLSDCSVVPPPAGIRCENGKAVLIKSNAADSPR